MATYYSYLFHKKINSKLNVFNITDYLFIIILYNLLIIYET